MLKWAQRISNTGSHGHGSSETLTPRLSRHQYPLAFLPIDIQYIDSFGALQYAIRCGGCASTPRRQKSLAQKRPRICERSRKYSKGFDSDPTHSRLFEFLDIQTPHCCVAAATRYEHITLTIHLVAGEPRIRGTLPSQCWPI